MRYPNDIFVFSLLILCRVVYERSVKLESNEWPSPSKPYLTKTIFGRDGCFSNFYRDFEPIIRLLPGGVANENMSYFACSFA